MPILRIQENKLYNMDEDIHSERTNMKIDNINCYDKVVYKYLCYFLDKISLEDNDSNFDKVNLRNIGLLKYYDINPKKQYYTGLIKFLKVHNIIECVSEGICFNNNDCMARLYKINFLSLRIVVEQFMLQTKQDKPFEDFRPLLRFKYKSNVPEPFKNMISGLFNGVEADIIFYVPTTCSDNGGIGIYY